MAEASPLLPPQQDAQHSSSESSSSYGRAKQGEAMAADVRSCRTRRRRGRSNLARRCSTWLVPAAVLLAVIGVFSISACHSPSSSLSHAFSPPCTTLDIISGACNSAQSATQLHSLCGTFSERFSFKFSFFTQKSVSEKKKRRRPRWEEEPVSKVLREALHAANSKFKNWVKQNPSVERLFPSEPEPLWQEQQRRRRMRQLEPSEALKLNAELQNVDLVRTDEAESEWGSSTGSEHGGGRGWPREHDVDPRASAPSPSPSISLTLSAAAPLSSHSSPVLSSHPSRNLRRRMKEREGEEKPGAEAEAEAKAEEWRLKRLFGAEGGRPQAGNFSWSVQNKEQCRGVVPDIAFSTPLSSIPILSVKDLSRPGLRTLVYLPRHGLGNSLRAYNSAFIFSILSGRRLVRFHAGPHRQTLTLLCTAFDCQGDMLDSDYFRKKKSAYHKFTTWYKRDELYPPAGNDAVRAALHDPRPLLWVQEGSSYDGYWTANASLRACVFAALECADEWCARSKALAALLRGGPAPALQRAVEEAVQGEAQGGPLRVPRGMGTRVTFDAAVHIRTLTRQREKAASEACARSGAECGALGRAVERVFAADAFWKCAGAYFARVRAGLASAADPRPRLSVFLATDNAALRPKFAALLRKHAKAAVYYSRGPVAHTSKAGGTALQGLPTMAEFYLLSRSRNVVAFKKPISTFAAVAGLYGNGSFVACAPNKKGQCWFQSFHEGGWSMGR